MPTERHLIGLLLGTEEDWPAAFEEIVRRLGPVPGRGEVSHGFDCERITIEPFGLRDRPRYDLVIDRLAYWYYVPREWLKKVALMDNVYLLNSPRRRRHRRSDRLSAVYEALRRGSLARGLPDP